MCIIYNEKENYSGGGHVVPPTVYEINWNNKFILTKQHPKDKLKELLLRDYRLHAFDSLKKAGQIDRVHFISDSLSKVKFEINKEAGLFDNFKIENVNDLTFYYLIDTRERALYSTLFLNKQELDIAISKLNVGEFENKIYFD
ncbi:MAG: hypothetical protein R2753_15410 [Chitinophagales bacterium]